MILMCHADRHRWAEGRGEDQYILRIKKPFFFWVLDSISTPLPPDPDWDLTRSKVVMLRGYTQQGAGGSTHVVQV